MCNFPSNRDKINKKKLKSKPYDIFSFLCRVRKTGKKVIKLSGQECIHYRTFHSSTCISAHHRQQNVLNGTNDRKWKKMLRLSDIVLGATRAPFITINNTHVFFTDAFNHRQRSLQTQLVAGPIAARKEIAEKTFTRYTHRETRLHNSIPSGSLNLFIYNYPGVFFYCGGIEESDDTGLFRTNPVLFRPSPLVSCRPLAYRLQNFFH